MTMESNPKYYGQSDNGASYPIWDFIDHKDAERKKYKDFPREWETKPDIATRIVWGVLFTCVGMLGLFVLAILAGWFYAFLAWAFA